MSSLTTSCKGVFCLRAISKGAVVQVSEQSTKKTIVFYEKQAGILFQPVFFYSIMA